LLAKLTSASSEYSGRIAETNPSFMMLFSSLAQTGVAAGKFKPA
jgi:hypothetical protein